MKEYRDSVTSRAWTVAILVLAALSWPAADAFAQGVTTGSVSGIVTNQQQQPVANARILAIHEPSGTTYETTTRADGRYSIPAARVGGPYSITVAYEGGAGVAFEPQTRNDAIVNLGVATDVNFVVSSIVAVQESVTVVATIDPVFSSTRTGAATAIDRVDIGALPTISGRISDVTRLTPQGNGAGGFAGQDNRLNNVTIDGSFFNNSFGLGSEPGARTGVAPISLESIEQVQVSVAPYDVRTGSFVGAAINSVTRSGTNLFSGSVYHRLRNEDLVGTEAGDATVNPGTFSFRDTGFWASGPIVRNRLFVFGNYENEEEKRPLHTLVANQGGQPVGGSITRVLASDLTALSSFLSQNFNYNTGGFENFDDATPAKRYLVRADFNLTNANKISFRYNQLDSSSGNNLSTSSSAGIGRSLSTTGGLFFAGSTYSILENIKSGIGEWNALIGSSMSNNLIVGFTSNDESRGDIGPLFPFVDVLLGGSAYASFGSEPFSVQNELRYKTFQFQDSLTRYGNQHTLTFGASAQRYTSDNVFWSCCPQSNYTYNSLQDFYTDAAGYLANPNRTTSPVSLRRFKLRYSNVPGLDKPLQQLQVWYNGVYAQDEWRPRRDLTITAGVRADMSIFKNTAYQNAKADTLTFRDPAGNPIQFQTGEMPETKILWSPRAAANYDVGGRGQTQLRLGTGLFTGPPLYVWISNQLGNTGVLIGEIQVDNTTAFPFNPNPATYRPTNVTGEGAASYELNVTDRDFKFPQVWRTSVGVDQRLPGGLIGTVDFLYNKDVNGYAYYNANLPVPQSAFTGLDPRPLYTSNGINRTPGNSVTNAFVLTNQDEGKTWNLSASLSKSLWHGLSLRGAYSYGEAKNTIDPGSTASSSFNNNQHTGDPNNPGIGYSGGTQGHRVFIQTTYTKEYFGFGSTTVSTFWEARPSQQNFTTRGSYVFTNDVNGDGGAGNDLIYIPANTSEMNFVQFTHTNGRVFTAAEQATAFEAYIAQDPYLSQHRGEYAQRGGLALPVSGRMDLSVMQGIFRNVGSRRNAGEIRLDITNFTNLLNKSWGVGDRTVIGSFGAGSIPILTNAAADTQGRIAYRMAVVNNELVSRTFQKTSFLADVYQIMLSFRYSFN